MLVHCQGLTKRFRSQAAIDGFDFSFESGTCALLGANGAGKSTLLRLIAGLETPDSGTVEVEGRSVAKDPIRFKRSIGVLPDRLGLFEQLTLFENLQAVAPIYGLSSEETNKRAHALLELFDLWGSRHTPAANSSYGMRKKTAIAMALIHNPRVLLLDEPFEGVDPASSRRLEHVLLLAASQGIAVLYTSHMLSLVQRMQSRVIILKGGRCAWDSAEQGRPASLEQVYLETVGEPQVEALEWLRR